MKFKTSRALDLKESWRIVKNACILQYYKTQVKFLCIFIRNKRSVGSAAAKQEIL